MQFLARQQPGFVSDPIFERVSFSHESAASLNIIALSTGNRALTVQLIIDEAFNGATPTASVGISGNENLLMSTAQNNLLVPAKYETNPDRVVPAGTELFTLYLNLSGATTGSGTVLLYFT